MLNQKLDTLFLKYQKSMETEDTKLKAITQILKDDYFKSKLLQ